MPPWLMPGTVTQSHARKQRSAQLSLAMPAAQACPPIRGVLTLMRAQKAHVTGDGLCWWACAALPSLGRLRVAAVGRGMSSSSRAWPRARRVCLKPR